MCLPLLKPLNQWGFFRNGLTNKKQVFFFLILLFKNGRYDGGGRRVDIPKVGTFLLSLNDSFQFITKRIPVLLN